MKSRQVRAEALERIMHRRTQDSVLFTAMALSVIAGKVLSSAVATPEEHGKGESLPPSMSASAAETGSVPSNTIETPDTPSSRADVPGSAGAGAAAITPSWWPALRLSPVQSAAIPCDATAAQYDQTPATPPPSSASD